MSQMMGNDCKNDDEDVNKEFDALDAGGSVVSLEEMSSPIQDDDRTMIDCDCDMLFDCKQGTSLVMVLQKNVQHSKVEK